MIPSPALFAKCANKAGAPQEREQECSRCPKNSNTLIQPYGIEISQIVTVEFSELGIDILTTIEMSVSIFTVGYANRSIEDLIALLRREGISFLVDVRSNPSSRFKPEFSSKPLDEKLRAAGIRYVFMGDTLGGRPPDLSCYNNGHVVYSLVQQRDFFRAGIDRLLVASAKGIGVSLLCSESRPEDCHRSKLIGVALAERGANVVHLGPQGERLSQAEVLARLKTAQADLFDSSLQSRKAYRPTVPRQQFGK